MSTFLQEGDEISLELSEGELWLLHDGFHYHDSGDMSKSLIERAWYAILQMSDTKAERIPFPLSKEELLLVLDRIPSNLSEHARGLLTACIRALWQLEYGIRVLDSEPCDECDKRAKFAVFKKRVRKGKSKLPNRPEEYEVVRTTASPQ